MSLWGCRTRDHLYDALVGNSCLMRGTLIPICRRRMLLVCLARLQLLQGVQLLLNTLFVRNGPVGAHNFQTGVRRRKYKLGSTKQ